MDSRLSDALALARRGQLLVEAFALHGDGLPPWSGEYDRRLLLVDRVSDWLVRAAVWVVCDVARLSEEP